MGSFSIGGPSGAQGGGSFIENFDRQMEGSGNGASLIKLIWALFWIQIMFGA